MNIHEKINLCVYGYYKAIGEEPTHLYISKHYIDEIKLEHKFLFETALRNAKLTYKGMEVVEVLQPSFISVGTTQSYKEV